MFASVQPKGQQAVDAINSYQSVVNLLNTSLQMALAANRTTHETISFLSSLDQVEAAVNQSVADSRVLEQIVDQLNSTFAESG